MSWVERRCRVYWGSHGCQLDRGHEGPHRCDDDCPSPERYSVLFGEDTTEEERAGR